MAEVREPEQIGVSKKLVNVTDKFTSPRQCEVMKHTRIASQNSQIVAEIEKIANTS